MSKICKKCEIEKPISDYNKARGGRNGISAICRSCHKANCDKIRKRYVENRVHFEGQTKYCQRCETTLPIDDFYKVSTTSSGWSDYCKRCNIALAKKWRDESKLKAKEAPPEKTCSTCGLTVPKEHFWHDIGTKDGLDFSCKSCKLKACRTTRIQALAYYSEGNKPKCTCCGEEHLEFLAIDHINGGGCKHRKELKSLGLKLYRWLRENNFPEGYRCLCHNCNQSHGLYGYCPHEHDRQRRERSTDA